MSDENPSSVSRVFCADGRTDRHVEANSRFSQFLYVPYKMIIKTYRDLYLSEVLVILSAELQTTTKRVTPLAVVKRM